MAARAKIGKTIKNPGQQALHLEAEGVQNHRKETVLLEGVAPRLLCG